MAPPTAAPSRPYQGLLVAVHLLLAFAGGYKLRVETTLNGVPDGFQDVVDSAVFPNGLPLKTRYLGVPAIDNIFPFLVVAFVAGPAGWDTNVRLQQMHFLYNFAGILAVLVVESRRRANASRLITWIALWAVFYQTVGGNLIVPLWFAVDLMTSNDANGLFTPSATAASTKRDVPLPYAQFILPATILGYLLPTALLYVPWGWSHEVNQLLAALWQPAPMFVSLFLVLFAGAAKSLAVTTSARTTAHAGGFPNGRDVPPRENLPEGDATPPDDVFYLKTYYLMVGMLCFVVHAYVLYQIHTDGYLATDTGSHVTWGSVFVPSQAAWKDSVHAGLHYIFQWDAIGIFGTSWTWSCVKAWDVLRVTPGQSGGEVVKTVLLITVANVVIGPGAALMAVWYWRENKLVELAAREAGRETKKIT
ncbi:uncharacterized protein B0I36DRAFT_155436 [Microdochium trichocladiopsis]|uniref:Uncharacterized protein n=1 Tax=Microdochium trichocladiopsis TaxID=1682393 RepID=A0A9P8Y1A3_9PEZI|nr:uncharacterized protein B0I36DRAFT_155436 [Microdochium trichocladiopsis]KAH7026221.1 hypothetical protein B0I36DRAFT_155436 [Microdochium trichocladiopsis]